MCYYATLNRLSNLNLLLLAPTSADQPALDHAGLARHIRRYVLAQAITKACTPAGPIGTRVPPVVVTVVDD